MDAPSNSVTCPRCGYPVSTDTQAACSECGLPTADILASVAYRARLRDDLNLNQRRDRSTHAVSILLTIAVLLVAGGVGIGLRFDSVVATLITTVIATVAIEVLGLIARPIATYRPDAWLRSTELSLWGKHARMLYAGWWAFPIPVACTAFFNELGGRTLPAPRRDIFYAALGMIWLALSIAVFFRWRSRYLADRRLAGLTPTRPNHLSTLAGGMIFVPCVLTGLILYMVAIALLYPPTR